MTPFLYEVALHWKLHLRSKESLVHFYVVPLIFYLFIGGIFTSINPESYQTIIPAMAVFGVTMGGVLGSPYALVEFYSSDIKKAYQIGHIPIWTVAVGHCISTLLHLVVMSSLILMSAPLIFHAPMPANLFYFYLSLLLFIIASISIGLNFGLYFKNASKMSLATQLVFLPSIMLSGIMFPASFLPKPLQLVGQIFPATWGFQAMSSAFLDGKLILPLIIISIVGIICACWKLKRLQAI